jgi:hypothetical protein
MNQIDGKFRSTPISHTRQRRQYWEDLDDREVSTQATIRNRSSGQRSVRSNGSSVPRHYQLVAGDDSAGEHVSDREPAPVRTCQLRKSNGATRKSSGNSSSSHTVAFEESDQVVTVPVQGVMRSARSRVATPFLSGDAVDKLIGSTNPIPPVVSGSSPVVAPERSQVNFESNISVVEVAVDESDEPGHQIRSVRGRIATPFIHDVPSQMGTTDPPKNDE